MSPVRLAWVPPHSSTEKLSAPIESTRTSSSYFSPNNAMAPSAFADSMSISLVLTSVFTRICWLTFFSTADNSSAVMASKWAKSKRKRSYVHKEPFCWTCSPNCSRNAACNKCVAEWCSAVCSRLASSTFAVNESPRLIEPDFTSPWCKWFFCSLVVSVTMNSLPPFSSRPLSPTWPPDSP